MIEAAISRNAADYIDAIERLRSAIEQADLWRLRYELGRTYLEAGFFVEAFDEFQTCFERRGEATAMFLDDMPTYRYLANLPYWSGRAEEGLGMEDAARDSFDAYLALRPSGGRFVADARNRLD